MIQSLVYAVRVLRKSPGFTAVAVCSLAIGIGANAAIFSLADALLLRPLPVLHPSEVASVTMHSKSSSISGFTVGDAVSYRDYMDFRERSHGFDSLTAFSSLSLAYTRQPGAMAKLTLGYLATGNLFQAMGVEPALGRGFRPDEDRVPDRDAVVVLGHDFWMKEFGGDAKAVGERVRLNGKEFTIIGVAPEHFTGMDQFVKPALYLPMAMAGSLGHKDWLENRGVRVLTVKGRLKAGVSLAQAQSELNSIAQGLEQEHPDTNRGQGVLVQSELRRRFSRSPIDGMIVAMMMVLSLCVLLVACANVAGLLLSRARARTREIAVRLAIGAKRANLIRQLLLESLLVALAGGGIGIGVAYIGVHFLSRITIPTDLPIGITVELDNRVLLVALAASLASTLVFGLVPAIGASRVNLIPALKAADADTAHGKRRLTGRNALVVGQIAVSLMLLSASVYLLRGISDELGAGPGFRLDHLLMASYNPSLVGDSPTETSNFYKRLVEDAVRIPGADNATLCEFIPMSSEVDASSVVPEGFEMPKDQEAINLFSNVVDEHFFDVLRIPVVNGRGFRTSDKADAPRVAVVNEQFARHYFPNQNAVGKRLHLGNRNGPAMEIVGVVKTTKVLWIGEPATEFLYLPYAQNPKSQMTMLVETTVDPASLSGALRSVAHNIDANQPAFDVRTMEYFYQKRAVEAPNLITQTIGTLGLMGMTLAMIGLYGLVAFSVSRRTREIGVRMAIGADRWSVSRLVLRQALVLSLIGLVIGLALSAVAIRGLGAIFSGPGVDISTMTYVSAGMLAVTLIAAYGPAYRASRLDPMRVLRDE